MNARTAFAQTNWYWGGHCIDCHTRITNGSQSGYCGSCAQAHTGQNAGALIAPIFVEKSWCNQCERLLRPAEGAMCSSGYCKYKNDLLADKIQAELQRPPVHKERG